MDAVRSPRGSSASCLVSLLLATRMRLDGGDLAPTIPCTDGKHRSAAARGSVKHDSVGIGSGGQHMVMTWCSDAAGLPLGGRLLRQEQPPSGPSRSTAATRWNSTSLRTSEGEQRGGQQCHPKFGCPQTQMIPCLPVIGDRPSGGRWHSTCGGRAPVRFGQRQRSTYREEAASFRSLCGVWVWSKPT